MKKNTPTKIFNKFVPWLYLLPGLVLVVLVVVFPIGYTGYISFTNMSLYHWTDYGLVGFRNYARAFSRADSEFLKSFLITLLWTVVNMILQVSLSFLIALGLNAPGLRLAKAYKTILMIPWALPGYVSILLWRVGVFNGEFGLLAKLAMVFGLGKTNFLTTYWGAFFSCLILNLWMAMPFMITMIDGALQSVDRSLYESAKLDGAGFFRTHLAITWPSVWPIIAPSVAMTTFVQFKQFDIVYLLTLQPGENTGAGLQTVITLAYTTAFTSSNYGLSSAVSTIIFLIIVILFALLSRRAFKEAVS
jgi:arabinogalactan oligomer/maltooligosaccharide transport system permease protein